MAVYSGGTSLAATAGKKAVKEVGEEVVEEVVEKAIKETVEEGLEAGGKKALKEGIEKIGKEEADDIAKVVAKKKLLQNEGDIGTFKELKDAGSIGDDITPHHMPSDAYMEKNNIEGYIRDDGLSMNMEQPHPGTGGRHRRTSTYDNQMTKAEQQAYWDLSPRDALAHDIKDLRRIYQEDDLYNKKIRKKLQEYIKQQKENPIFNR